MKIFISWSGSRSKLLAEGLHGWIPGVINAAEPWISSSDITPGTRWSSELAKELEETKYGIICVTAENQNNPWLMFEAGALSKVVHKSQVVPLILDIKPTDIQGPLAQFQSLQVQEEDVKKLIADINDAIFKNGEKGIDKSFIEESFKLWWPKLKQWVEDIPKVAEGTKSQRTDRELIEESLRILREMSRKSLVLEPIDSPTYVSGIDEHPAPQAFPDGWEQEWQAPFDAKVVPTRPSEIRRKKTPILKRVETTKGSDNK